MTTFRSRAPLRVGLAGGGSDVSPFCDQYGGCVLNASIDRYAYASIELNEKFNTVIFKATDKEEEEHHSSGNAIDSSGLILHAAVYNRMCELFNNGEYIPMTLTTYCDAPPGSGLGSSSTVVVAIIQVFMQLFNAPLDDYGKAELAYNIERKDCGLSGGKQDQYSASFGGLNFIEFKTDSTVFVNTLRARRKIINELEASFILYSTGISRKSANIIDDQMNSLAEGNEDSLDALIQIRDSAFKMKEAILKGDLGSMVDLLNFSWNQKKRSSKSVSSKYLDAIFLYS